MRYLVLLPLLLLAACAPRHDDPQVFWDQTPKQSLLAANLQAKDVSGTVYVVADTHSMEPLLMVGDYVVVDPHFPFASLRRGQVVTYAIELVPHRRDPITHRTQDQNPAGWVMRGDNANPQAPETFTMTEHDYIGKVVGVYTTRTKP